MNDRQLPRSDYFGIKGATRELVGRAGTNCTRVDQQTLSKYGNPGEDHAERFMPVDVVADLEAECGLPIVTRKLAELSGCLLVPLPRGTGHGALTERSHRTAQEFAEVMAGILAALADQVMTEEEAQPVLTNIHELMLECAALAEEVKASARRRTE